MGRNKKNRLKFVPLSSKEPLQFKAQESGDPLVIKDEHEDKILHIGSVKCSKGDDLESLQSRKTSSPSSGVYSSLHSSERSSSTSPTPLSLVNPLSYPNRDKDLVQVIADGMAGMNYGLARPGVHRGFGLKRIKLSVNCVEVKDVPDEVYQYTVDLKPDTTPMSIRRKVLQAFIKEKGESVFIDSINGTPIHPAYDGSRLLFSRTILNLPLEGKLSGGISYPDEHSGLERKYSISIQFQAHLNLKYLMNKLFGDPQESSSPDSVRKVVETILRHQLSLDYVAVGLNFFQEQQGRVYLGNGREAWIGYHQNVIPCNGRLGMVIDVACSAFYKEQRLVEFVTQFLDTKLETLVARELPKEGCLNSVFTEDERRLLTNEISGLKIKTTHGNTPRLFRAVNMGRLLPQHTFFEYKVTGQRVSVASFFKSKYGLSLEYPMFPCLHVVKGGRISYLPLELCWLVRGQRVMKKLTEQQATSMIKLMASSAPNRQRDVQVAADFHKVTESSVVRDFGIRKESEMMKARGHVLRPPMIEYNERNGGGPVDVLVNRGSWDAHQKEFKEPKGIFYWAILNLSPTNVSQEKMASVTHSLIRQGKINGLDINPVYDYREIQPPASKDDIEMAFNELKRYSPNISFVFIVLDGRQSTYSFIKSKGDKDYGFISQCIRWKSICKGMRGQMYSNLIMKINFKLGGTNGALARVSKSSLRVFDSPVIIMGATLSHPHNPEPKRPSVASLVGSMDPSPSQFIAYSTVQSKIHQHIVNLSEMVQSALMDFYVNNGKLKPHRIIFYRDALRASLFLTITKCEVIAIRRACLALEEDYRPGITFVVIQRRHNTRLFCGQHDSNGKAGNVPAGTCLDHTITHPKHFDFYLSSHFGIQGTSRPTYYRVMWDDNHTSPEDIQNLSYSLCHCYSRCTKSVAIPAPSYYAHLAAVRTRHHIANGDLSVNFDEEGLPINEEDVERAKQILTIHENNKYKMYFT